MSKVLGIDLGTTNSVVAVMQGGTPRVIPNQQGSNLTPSIVSETPEGETLVGIPAKNQAILNPKNTLFSLKRLIGRRWSDKEVQKDVKLFPFEMREDKNGGVEVKMGDKWYKPQEISARVLQKIKQDAEAYFGETITEAVITVPAYFDDAQRQATKDAGKIAGLNVQRILNEPTAAALAYGLDKKKEGKIAVFDLGGGTFDISILDVGDGVFEVLATRGDTHLGGDDFDQVIIDMLVKEFKDKEGVDLTEDRAALQRLKEAAEKAKIELSQAQETNINIPYITATKEGPKHLMRKMTRAELEKLTGELINRLEQPCKDAMSDAKLSPNDVGEVILVGGMTRMPLVREKVKQIFGKEPKQDVNPDEVVALGAAVQAGILKGEVTDITLLDVTPLSLGIETLGGVMTVLIPRNTTIPVEKKQTFTTAADNQPSAEVHVLQGERPMATDNKTLARFILDGIPPAPRGIPQIEIMYKIDANGILNVSAKDTATGKEQKVTITASTGLTDDEINKLVDEAQKHADEDKKKKEVAELRNKADSLTFLAEKTLTDMKDKVSEDDKTKVEGMVKEVREILAKDAATINKDELQTKTDELSKLLSSIGEKAYKTASPEAQPQAGDQPAAETSANEKGDEPVEGEVVGDK
jgi:molecular chaperone DnaK